MKQVTEQTPTYNLRTDTIIVAVNGVVYCWAREAAESLFESLRVGLYEASLFDDYRKKHDRMKKEASETVEDS